MIGLVGCTGVALTLSTTFVVHRSEVNKEQARFEQQTAVLVSELQGYLDDYTQLTRSVGSFFDTAESINLQDFQELSRSLLPYYNSFLGLGWTEQVEAEERFLYEQQWQNRGDTNFFMYEFDSQQNPVLAQSRSVHFPTTYLESLEKLQYSVGWDAASDSQRLLSLKKAESLGILMSTPLVTLESGKPGFVLYYPIFTTSDSTQANSQSIFQGAIFGFYELETWIQQAIVDLNLTNLDFYIFDLPQDQLNSALNKTKVSPNRSFLVAYKDKIESLTQSPQVAELSTLNSSTNLSERASFSEANWLFYIRSLNMPQRELSILILPTANQGILSWRVITVLALGLLLTGSLIMYLFISKQATLKLEGKNQELQALFGQLKQTQSQLIQTEKMSSLGKLVAGVAHEINNPVGFIAGNVEYAKNYCLDLLSLLHLYQAKYPQPSPDIQEVIEQIELDFILEDLPKLLKSMEFGAERLHQIVLSLRMFSRLDEAELKGVDIHTGIDSTLMILNSRLKTPGSHPDITIKKNYGKLPLIECYAGQLNQVFLNILTNAIDALEESLFAGKLQDCLPIIEINTAQIDADWIVIQIIDNGLGITPEVLTRLFDPFFTTKSVGKGTGLGLSISYQIIHDRHGGYLECSSKLGQGTEFLIKLPVHLPSSIKSEPRIYSSVYEANKP